MAATSNTNFERAVSEFNLYAGINPGYKEIASLCKDVNPEWAEQLDGKEGVYSIEEARKRLDKIAVETIQCSALILKDVRFHREINKTEQVVSTPVYIGNKPEFKAAIQKQYKISDETTVPLSQKEIDFYLMWGGKVYRVQMSSQSDCVAELPKIEADNSYVWDTSTSQIREMAKRNFSNCFVTAIFSWNKSISLK